MKKCFLTALFSVSISVLATADERAVLICKWCGSDNFSVLRQLLIGDCGKSPSGKHQPYEGGKKSEYICKNCGATSTSLRQLIISPCNKSPRGYHVVFEGRNASEYFCKICGQSSRNLKQIIISPCRKSPSGYHQPLEQR